jgi:hypothetical protein
MDWKSQGHDFTPPHTCSLPTLPWTGQYRVPPGGHQPGVEFKGQAQFQGQGQFHGQGGQFQGQGRQFNPPVGQGQGQFQGHQQFQQGQGQQFQQGQGQQQFQQGRQFNPPVGQGQFQGQQQFNQGQGQMNQGQGQFGQFNQGQGHFKGPQFEEKDGLKFQGNEVKFQTPDPKLAGHENIKGQPEGHNEGQGQAVKGDGSEKKESNGIKLPDHIEEKLPKY